MRKPLIFITNDDGVGAKGLREVIEVAREFGRVVVIAPETTQSGKAHAITMYSPLYLRTVHKSEGLEIYACAGTPVDCIKMGFDHLLADQEVALTISGINHGSNAAISVLYSGTMGAAIEASFYGAPSVGLSLLDHRDDADFSGAKVYARRIIAQVLESKIELPLCLNVNIPAVAVDMIQGVKVCRQCHGYWKEEFVCRKDPRGVDYYWLTGNFLNLEPENDQTDEWALQHNYVSVVPIQVDMTNYKQIKALSAILT